MSDTNLVALRVRPWIHEVMLKLLLFEVVFLRIEQQVILCLSGTLSEREREREREIHYVHSASLAYEDGIVFMSEPSAARQ